MGAVKSDIEIARSAKMQPIQDILAKINVPNKIEAFSPIGPHIAKINLDYLEEIKDNKQIAIYYCDRSGHAEEQYNPNGSIKNIAGIFNKEKNVLGMMPHPERMIDKSLSGEDGSLFFKNLINNLK